MLKFENEILNELTAQGYALATAGEIAKNLATELPTTSQLLQKLLDKNVRVISNDDEIVSSNADDILVTFIQNDFAECFNFIIDRYSPVNLDGLNRYLELANEYLDSQNRLFMFTSEIATIASVLHNDDDIAMVKSLLEDTFATCSNDYAQAMQKVATELFYGVVYSYCCGVRAYW